MSHTKIAPLILAAALAAWPAARAAAEVPGLLPVPDELTASARDGLDQEWRSLQARLAALQSAGAAFNAACADVKAGSAADQSCAAEYAELESRRRVYAADAGHYNDRVRAASAASVKLATSWPGALALPAASWDCYCIYRYVTRPNGRTHPEALRTPEGQAAFDALKAADRALADLTRARDRAFALPDNQYSAILKFAAKHLAVHTTLAGLEAAGGPLGATASVASFFAALEMDKDAWVDVPREVQEVVDAKAALEDAGRVSARALEDWRAANERAKNVAPVEYLVSNQKPYTMTFSNGADGATVAVVTPSPDGLWHARVAAR